MNRVSVDEFMDACRDFEATVKLKYHLDDNDSAYMYIAQLPKYTSMKEEVHVIRTLRNMYAHNNMQIDGEDILTISPLLLTTLKKLTHSISNPILVKDVMITNLFKANWNEKVVCLMQKMKEKGISHTPVLDEDNKLLGVFSQNTLFIRLSDEEASCINREDTLEQYAKYLPIHMHENESFDFIGCEDDIEKAKAKFKRTRKSKKRVVMLFVTKNGDMDERVLGILTPWDVID